MMLANRPSGAALTLDRNSFGAVLRAGRERRHVSLDDLSRETRVRPEVWAALEAGDFSGWPSGIYARSLVRQYAERVALDPEALVNEFCRLFPNGDRRAERLFQEYAAIVAHEFAGREHAATPRRRANDALPAAGPADAMLDTLDRTLVACVEWTRRRIGLMAGAYRAAREWTMARGIARV